MSIGLFVRFEAINAFAHERRISAGEAVKLVVEARSLDKLVRRSPEGEWLRFTVTDGSHFRIARRQRIASYDTPASNNTGGFTGESADTLPSTVSLSRTRALHAAPAHRRASGRRFASQRAVRRG